jgi:hypothetical protein
MPRDPPITGKLADLDDPVWEPLLVAVGGRDAGWYMWMGAIELSDGSLVHGYKHRTTRRYAHLGEDGRAWKYLGDGRYREIDVDHAVHLALAGWEELDDDP